MADEGMVRSDFASEDFIKAPLEHADNLDKMAESYERVIVKTKEVVKANEREEQSITDLTHMLSQLTRMEQQLVDVENKHAVTVNKLTETQKRQAVEIEKLNKQLKEKKKNEEDSAKAIDALDNRTGGLISSFKSLGKEMMALAASPWIAAVGILVGTFFALRNAADVYYKTSGEGEDRLAEKLAASDAALNVVKRKWAELGGEVDKAQKEQMGFWASLVAVGSVWVTGSTKTLQQMNKAADDARAIAKEFDAFEEAMADNQRDRAKDEAEIAELLYKSKQKNLYSDKERLEFLKNAQNINLGLIQDEQVFAEQKVGLLEKQFALNHGISESELRAMSDAEKHSILITKEYNELIAAQTKVIQLSGKFYEEERKNAGAISGIIEAQKAERTKAHEQRVKELEDEMKKRDKLLYTINQAEVDFQNEVLENFQKNYKTKDDITKDSLLGELEYMELLEEQKEIDHAKDIARWEALLTTALQFGNAFADLFSTIFSRKELEFDKEEKRIKQTLATKLKALDAETTAAELTTTEATRVRDEAAFASAQKEKAYKEEAARDTEELEKKKREQARKTAIFDKALAFAQAGINLSLAIIKVLENPLQVALVSVLGAIQLGAIAARPIPALFKGAKNFAGGLAKVGDRGRELVKIPGALPFLAEHETTMFLPPGTDVLTNQQTERAISQGIDYKRMGKAVAAGIPDYLRVGTDIYKALRDSEGSVTRIRKNLFPYG